MLFPSALKPVQHAVGWFEIRTTVATYRSAPPVRQGMMRCGRLRILKCSMLASRLRLSDHQRDRTQSNEQKPFQINSRRRSQCLFLDQEKARPQRIPDGSPRLVLGSHSRNPDWSVDWLNRLTERLSDETEGQSHRKPLSTSFR